MKVDLYTKSILTIIAACLIALSVHPLLHPPAVMAQPVNRVVIAGIDTQNPQLKDGLPIYLYSSNPQQSTKVNLVTLGGLTSMPVNVVGGSTAVPVRVVGAGDTGQLPLPINVVQVAGKTIEQDGVPVKTQK
jgi:hypothetical protein